MKIEREIAEKEVSKWLETLRIRSKKLETLEATIESLIVEVEEGLLIINEDGTLTQKLEYPVLDSNNNEVLTELKFKSRLILGEFNAAAKGNSASDIDARLLAYVVALTGASKGLLNKMDMRDASLSQSIISFFM